MSIELNQTSSVKTPLIPTLVAPSEEVFGYGFTRIKLPELSVNQAEDGINHFNATAKNFGALLDLSEQGKLLGQLLACTTHQSFLDGALTRLGDRSTFQNMFRQLLDGHHTRSHSYIGQLPGLGMFFDYYSSTPIPANLELIAEGNASLRALRMLTEGPENLLSGGRGVTAGNVTGGKVEAHGLEVSVFGDGRPVEASMVSGESSTLRVGDKIYYNGLPGDRGKFPTFALGEGETLQVLLRNTSSSDTLYVMPTINGMPFHVEHLYLKSGEFFSTPLPIVQVNPHMFKLEPGAELRLNHFQVDKIGIIRRDGFVSSTALDNITDRIQLAPYIADRVAGSLGEKEKELLGDSRIPAGYRNHLRHACELAYLQQALVRLDQAKKTTIEIRRPIIADGLASTELANPMVGSLGVAIVRLEPIPVEATHRHSFYSDVFAVTKGGGTFGVGGLASIGGGADMGAFAARPNILEIDKSIHRFLGYVPMNLMSVQ